MNKRQKKNDVTPYSGDLDNFFSSLAFHNIAALLPTDEHVRKLLEDMKVLPSSNSASPKCPKCGGKMSCCRESTLVGFRYRCNLKVCKASLSMANNTWIEKGKMSLRDYLLIIFYFVEGIKMQTVVRHMGISTATATDHFNYLKEVATYKIRSEMKAIGGPGTNVEVDETFVRRKYGRGRQTWWEKSKYKILGGICRETKDLFILVIPNLTKATIWPLLYEYILPGTTIHTDSAKVYDGLCKESGKEFGFEFKEHHSVNHSAGEYVRRTDDGQIASTNSIECSWRWMKETFSTGHGSSVDDLKNSAYFYLYKTKYFGGGLSSLSPGNRLRVMLGHISEYFPGPTKAKPVLYKPWKITVNDVVYDI